MNQHQMYQKKYPQTYNLFGIYVDWQIDNNQIYSDTDINSISSFESFLEMKGWKVVEIVLEGKRMIALDIEFPNLRFLNMLGILPERVLSDKMCAADAEYALQRYLEESGLPYFDIFEYYMDHAPWNLKSNSTYSTHPAMSQNSGMIAQIDESLFDNCIIIKVMTDKGEERITSANDVFNGGMKEHEYLIDATRYDEETSLLMEQSWSERLGIPVLQSEELIDINYRYNSEECH